MVGGDVGEWQRRDAAGRERLRYRERAVDEVGAGCEQRQLDRARGEAVQRKQRFERGDAAAADDDA